MLGAYLKSAYIQLSDGHWPGSLVACLVTRSSDSHHSSQSCRACCQAFSLNRLRSRSLSWRHCSPAFAQLHRRSRCLLNYNYKSAWTFHHREIFEYAHLKFTVSSRSKPTSIHTRVRNAVTLVWGSLRLAPISCRLPFLSFSSFFLQSHQVWSPVGESSEPSATSFHASSLTALHAHGSTWTFVRFCHPEVNDVIKNGPADKICNGYLRIPDLQRWSRIILMTLVLLLPSCY